MLCLEATGNSPSIPWRETFILILLVPKDDTSNRPLGAGRKPVPVEGLYLSDSDELRRGIIPLRAAL